MEAIEDDRFARELTLARSRGDMDAFARVLSGRLRQMDKRSKAANIRADETEAELARLRTALEAETEAKLRAEARVEKLRAYATEVGTALVRLTCDGSEFYRKAGDVFEVDPAACSAWVRRSRQSKHETIVRLTNQKNELQAELARLRRAAPDPASRTEI